MLHLDNEFNHLSRDRGEMGETEKGFDAFTEAPPRSLAQRQRSTLLGGGQESPARTNPAAETADWAESGETELQAVASGLVDEL